MNIFQTSDILKNCFFTKIDGSGNDGYILNSNHSNIKATSCKLKVSNCNYAELHLLASNLQLENSNYAKIQGKDMAVLAGNCNYPSITLADKGQFILQDNSYFSWEGKEGMGVVKEDQYTTVVGDKNNVKSYGSRYLKIEGKDNQVEAFKNSYLTIEGNDNEVMAAESKYVTIQGNHNDVKVKHVPGNGICHVLERVANDGKNELTLSKSTRNIKGVTGNGLNIGNITFGGTGMVSINGGSVQGHGGSLEVNLKYLHSATIDENTYTCGIFQFQLHRVNEDKAVVAISKEGMEGYGVDTKKNKSGSVVVIASRNGKIEEFKLRGEEVKIHNAETHFEVTFKKSPKTSSL